MNGRIHKSVNRLLELNRDLRETLITRALPFYCSASSEDNLMTSLLA